MIRNLILLACLTHGLFALADDTPVPEAAKSVKASYDSVVAEAQKKYTKAILPATNEYSKKLGEMLARAKDAGNLDAVLQIQAETERLSKKDAGKAGKLPPDATKAFQIYDAALAKARAGLKAELKDLHAAFLSELIDIEKAETKSGNLTSAVSIRDYRQQMEKADIVVSSGNTRLTKAKETYDTEIEQFKKSIVDSIEKRAEIARKKSDLKMLEKIKVERIAFDDLGELASDTPQAVLQKASLIRSRLDLAYRTAIKECTTAKKDQEAQAIDKDYQEFKRNPIGVTAEERAKCHILGKWKIGEGPNANVIDVFADGSVVEYIASGAVHTRGKWTVERSGTVLVTLQNGFNSRNEFIQRDTIRSFTFKDGAVNKLTRVKD